MKTAAELAAEQAAYWNGPGGEGLARRLPAHPARDRRHWRRRPGGGRAAAWRACHRYRLRHRRHDGGAGEGCRPHRSCAGRRHLRAPHHGSARASIGQCHVRRRRCRHASVPGRPLRSRLLSLRCHVLRRPGRRLPQHPAGAEACRSSRLHRLAHAAGESLGHDAGARGAAVPAAAAAPGPEDPGQFAFGDRARVERILGEAGFKALRFEPIDQQIWMGDTVAEVVAGAGKFGPLARAFAGASLRPSKRPNRPSPRC